MKYVSQPCSTRKSAFGVLSTGLALLALFGCNGGDSGGVASVVHQTSGQAQVGKCTESFSQSLEPLRIDGHKQLYFDPAAFRFLLNADVEVESLVLRLSLRGDRGKDSDVERAIDLNGQQTYSAGGLPFYDFRGFNKGEDASRVDYHLHKMRVNGADSVLWMMAKIVGRRGELKLGLHGKALYVLSAAIDVNGTRTVDCNGDPEPEPTPTGEPTPTPSPSSSPTPAVPPRTSILAIDPAGPVIGSSSISFQFGSDQVGVSYLCALDGAEALPCADSQTYSGLANGSHSLRVFARSAAGLVDAAGAAHAWIVDTVPPSVEILNAASLPTLTREGGLSVEFAAVDANPSGFRCSLDGALAEDCASPLVLSGLAEGRHEVSVTAVDSAGNQSLAPASFRWEIDFTAPSVRFTEVLPVAAISNATVKSLAFAASETSRFECLLDGVALAVCASPVEIAALAEGSHTFEVRAEDLAGNKGGWVSQSWVVDLSAPVVALGAVSPPEGLTRGGNISVEFSASEPAAFRCSLDGAAPASCSSPYVDILLGDGNHELRIVATDAAGNEGPARVVSWIADFSLPELVWGAMLPSAASFIREVDFSAEILSSESVQLSCSVNDQPLGVIASPLVLQGLEEGSYAVAVTGTDLAGNASKPLLHGFTVDRSPANLTVSALFEDVVTRETRNEFRFEADEPASFLCNLDGMGFSACASPLLVSGFADGEHRLELRALDRAGNPTDRTIHWSVDYTAPVTTIVASRTANAAISFAFSASEAVQGFECSLDGAAFGTCASPVAFDGLAAGNHVFQVRATDLVGNVESPAASSAWNVDPIARATITGANPAGAFVSSRSMSVSFVSTVAGASFQCSWDGGVFAPCVSPASISGLGDGSHSFSVKAVDRWGVMEPSGATYGWVVDATPPVVLTFTPTGGSYQVTVNWTTNEPSTSKVNWGMGTDTSRVTAEDFNYVTSHSVKISGLSPGTVYSFIVSGRDQAGNVYSSVKKQARTF